MLLHLKGLGVRVLLGFGFMGSGTLNPKPQSPTKPQTLNPKPFGVVGLGVMALGLRAQRSELWQSTSNNDHQGLEFRMMQMMTTVTMRLMMMMMMIPTIVAVLVMPRCSSASTNVYLNQVYRVPRPSMAWTTWERGGGQVSQIQSSKGAGPLTLDVQS